MSDREVVQLCEPFDQSLETIKNELEFVQSTLRGSNFCASFSNMAGIILRYRGDPQNDEDLKLERPGTIWAEGAVGTNGVGTCIIERRPVMVLGRHHYFRAYSSISCIAAPVTSADAEMIGVLNVATGDPRITSDTFALAADLTMNTAERLSNQLFLNHFPGSSILKIRGDGPTVLLALDDEQRIVGANKQARHIFGSIAERLNRATLWELFQNTPEARDGVTREGRLLGLRRIESEALWEAEVIVPKPAMSRRAVAKSPSTATSPAIEPATDVAHSEGPTIEQCLGSHPRLNVLSRLLRRISGSGLPILLLGETGVGKDTLAGALHREGDRSHKPLVAFNCAAIPETLIDSELFGYGAGAFTGAKREGNVGRLKQADGGTLFLDEIGDMPLSLQTRLLRVLETGEVSPLGSAKTQTVDINVIAATNNDLSAAVTQGRFRRDLYYRLAGVVVDMQPLRERKDILSIAHRLLASDKISPAVELSPGVISVLETYAWPGNIREMRYVLQRARRVCENGIIEVDDLLLTDLASPASGAPEMPNSAAHPRQALHDAERRMILSTLDRLDSDVSRTAEALDMSRATLYRKMRAHEIVARKVVRA
ncbi:sigma-54-dependent Fis family transcriptional regulator [Mesorhizobium sp. STM 4661]|uniref:sigma-54-dependent Fis family transcriptional regulator n=1 Tax=Mesorhizobium sp. STM 4661 TaxID=1297570 RepID=UPI00039A7015|nr:sigma-54-dependent Fis family transcriptional regulator [Mesorhizobium sp. STM 4661]